MARIVGLAFRLEVCVSRRVAIGWRPFHLLRRGAMSSTEQEESHSLKLLTAICEDQDLALSLAEQAAYDPEEMHKGEPLGHRPLLEAISKGHDALAKALFLKQQNLKAAAEWINPSPREVPKSVLVEAINGGCSMAVAAMAAHVDFGSNTAPLFRDTTFGNIALVSAARHRNTEIVKLLCKAGAGEHLAGMQPGLLLSWAFDDKWSSERKDKECSLALIESLLAADARPVAQGGDPWILTKAIAANSDIDIIEKMVEICGGAAIGAWRAGIPRANPLYLAADMGRVDAIQCILDALSEEEARELCSKVAYGWETILLRAARNCAAFPEELIRLSPVRHESGLPMSDATGNTPLHCSINSPTPDNALALIGHVNPLDANHDGDTALMLLARKNDVTPQWQAVALDWAASQPAVKNKRGESAVAIAIESGNAELALALIGKAPAEDMPWLWRKMIRAERGSEATQEAFSAEAEKKRMPEKSLAARALARRSSADGIDGALVRMAIKKGDEDFVLAAIERISDREIWSEPSQDERMTPLMLAAAHGSPKMVQALASRGCAKRQDKKGRTALMIAAKNGRLKCCEALIAHSDLGAEDHSGRTALSRAASSKNAKLVEFLASACEIGVINQFEPRTGHTPLSRAAKNSDADAVEALLRHGANALSGQYQSPIALIRAADVGCVRAVRAILPHCDPKKSSVMGRTPLLAAAMADSLGSPENREIISLLMPLSDLAHRDCFGDGVLEDLASAMNRPSQHDTASMLDFYNERALAIEEAKAIAGVVPSTGGEKNRGRL